MWILLLAGCTRVLDVAVDSPTPTTTSQLASVCVPGAAPGFALPSVRWGLAVLHAERRLAELENSALSDLSADFFLASAWQLSDFGCDSYDPPWAQNGSETCLGISEPVVWSELCKLYPEYYQCDAFPSAVEGDQIEAQVFALAWFAYAGHSLLGRYEVDPDTFYDAVSDPRAIEKATAIMHFNTPWHDFDTLFADCPDALEQCLTYESRTHVDGISAKLNVLAEADCYTGALTEADVSAYVAGLATVWPTEDWPSAEAAAQDALTTGSFHTDAIPVLDAIDAVIVPRITCPEYELWSVYRLPCP